MMKRRQFLKEAACVTATFQIVPRHVLGQGFTPTSEKLNIAGIGVGGQGGGVLNDLKSENIVAMCDVDWGNAAHTARAFPKAELFKDYRVLLEKRKDIDAVLIATGDRWHSSASSSNGSTPLPRQVARRSCRTRNPDSPSYPQ